MLPTKKKKKEPFCCEALKHIDDRLSFLLDECSNGARIDHLNKNQSEELWGTLQKVFSENFNDKEVDASISKPIISLVLHHATTNITAAAQSAHYKELLLNLNAKALLVVDNHDRNSICKINELWLSNKQLPELVGIEIFTLRHLLQLALDEKPLMSNLNRLGIFRKHLRLEDLENADIGSIPLIISMLQKSTVVNSEPGQRFLGHVASMSIDLMEETHQTIYVELSTCDKKTAVGYGAIYVAAWYNSSDEIRSRIEERFQALMEQFFKMHRKSLDLSKKAANVLSVINVWNVEMRKKGNAKFISMITACYRPILWKYLESEFDYQRCNAFDAFFKAFPLQQPEDDATSQAELFTKQYDHMVSALRDDCPVIRIIGIREVCNILPFYWSQFTPEQIHQLMSIITKEDACDTSSADVRYTVWRGLHSFLSTQPAYEYLQQILPSIAHLVDDVNRKVRVAVLRLLIAIRDKKDASFKYTKVIPCLEILKRLSNENITVGRWMVRLVLPKIYNPKLDKREWIKHFVFLIKTLPHSYRNLFWFSSKELNLAEAHNIICLLIGYLGSYVTQRLSESDENDENDSIQINSTQSKGSRKRPKRTSLSVESVNSSPVNELENPEVITGLFDIVTILWVLHEEELQKIENADKRLKLYDVYVEFAQCFINYYKDSKIFISIITLSGNVPITILKTHSITLPGYCLKMLKVMQLEDESNPSEVSLSMLIALVKWGCASIILEQIAFSLEAAFDSEKRDFRRSSKVVKRVMIKETTQPNVVLAIRTLNILLKTTHLKDRIMQKDYDQLKELWLLMGNIKELLVRRLLRGQAYSQPLLNDEFLYVCYRRYVRLIPILHRVRNEEKDKEDNETEKDSEDEEQFNCAKEIMNMLVLAQDELMPLLQSENCTDIDLLANCINEVVEVCDNMVTCNLVDGQMYQKLYQTVVSLLTSEHELRFVSVASRVAGVLSYAAWTRFSKADQTQMMTVTIPSIISHLMNALVVKPYSIEIMRLFKSDLQVVRTNLGKILGSYEDSFRKRICQDEIRLFRLLVQKMLQTVRVALCNEAPREDLSVPVYSKVTQLPPAAATVLGPIVNKPSCSVIFLKVLKEQLGCSLKILLIDTILLHLFGKVEVEAVRYHVESVKTIAKERLKEFRAGRQSEEVRSLGISLTHVVDEEEDDDDDDGGGEDEGDNEKDVILKKRTTNSIIAESHSAPCYISTGCENTATATLRPSQPVSNLDLSLTPSRIRNMEPFTKDGYIDDCITCAYELLDAILPFKPPPSKVP